MGLIGVLAVRGYLISKIEQPMSSGKKMCLALNIFSADVFTNEISYFNVKSSALNIVDTEESPADSIKVNKEDLNSVNSAQ